MSDIEEDTKVHPKPKRARWFVLAFIIAAFFVGCPLFYISGGVDGRIIDAATGEPVANAHIVGIWELEGGLFEHAYLGPLHFEETVTDAEGRYHLDGFSFRFVTPNLSLAQLENRDPVIYIFAEGYRPTGKSGSWNRGRIYRKSTLDGQNIAVQGMEGITKEEARRWHSSVYSMKDHLHRCNLLKLSQTLSFLEKVQSEFKKSGFSYLLTYESEYINCK